MASQNYGGVIWTNHALDQLQNRKIDQDLAYKTFQLPDSSNKRREGASEFNRRFHDSTITVLAKQNEKGEWIIISVWIDPPMPGTKDHQRKEDYKKYRKASFLGKLFLTLKRQLGF